MAEALWELNNSQIDCNVRKDDIGSFCFDLSVVLKS